MLRTVKSKLVHHLLAQVLIYHCVQSLSTAKLTDIDKPIPVNVINTVAGYTARFECDLNSSRPDDSAYLVLWYIESEKQPIYSVDLRARPLEQAKHWKSERLSKRAHFNTSQPSVAALLLANVTEHDAGVYRCRVDFRQSPTRQIRYQLNVLNLPKLPVVYANGIQIEGIEAGPYDEGAELTLICEVAADAPSTSAAWYRNGEPVASSVEHRVHHTYYQLHLTSLSRADNRAEFACILKLDIQPRIAPLSQNLTLNIRSKPSSVEIQKSDAILEAWKERQIQCRAAGSNPPAIITWWIGNRQLTDVEITVADGTNGTVSLLTFIPALEDDGRVITCRAQTPHLSGGFVEDSVRLQVLYPPQVSLVLGQRFTPDEIYEGSDIYLECQTRSNPAIHKLLWLHNGKPLSSHRSNERDIFISNQSLVIRQVNRHSSGNYTCVATNRVADTESHPLEINVKYAPVCKHSKPVTVVVSPDEPVSLNCQVDADPARVSFRWTLSTSRETALVPREVPVDSGLSSVLEYRPRHDSDFGQLQCWAMNIIGKQREPCVFNLIKEGLPVTPKHCVMQRYLRTALEIRCNNVSREKDHLESESANGSTVYLLQLYNAETGALVRNMSNKLTPWFNITGIELTTKVSAIITAVNKQGRSDSVTLEGALERAVGSRSVNDAKSTESFLILIAAPGALLIVIIGLAAILAIYQRHYKRSMRNQSVQSASQPVAEHHNQELNNKVSMSARSPNNKPTGAVRFKQDASQLDENRHQSLVTIAGSSNEEAYNDSTYVQSGRQPPIDRDRTTFANPQCKPGIIQMQQQHQALNLQARQRPAGIHFEQSKRIYHER